MVPTRAVPKLKARIAELGISNNEAARRVSADPGNFSRYLTGRSRPSIDIAVNIEREFDVPVPLWTEQITNGDEAA